MSATITCGTCGEFKPLLGSCGGGPAGTKRTCVDCRAQYDPEVKPKAVEYRRRGLSFRKIAERLMEQHRPAPSAWIVAAWCRDAGVIKRARNETQGPEVTQTAQADSCGEGA